MRSKTCSTTVRYFPDEVFARHHILIWAAGDIGPIPKPIRLLIEDENNELLFSPASIWETAIRHGLRRSDSQADPYVLRHRLTENGYLELPINTTIRLPSPACRRSIRTPSIVS